MNLIFDFVKKFFPQLDLVKIAIVVIGIPLLLLVVFNMNSISESLGFETKQSLRSKFEAQQHINKNLMEENENLTKELQFLKDQHAKDLVIIQELRNREVVVTKKVTDVVTKKTKKIAAIKTDVKKTPAQKSAEISVVQIGSLWSTFCMFNQHEACPSEVMP